MGRLALWLGVAYLCLADVMLCAAAWVRTLGKTQALAPGLDSELRVSLSQLCKVFKI